MRREEASATVTRMSRLGRWHAVGLLIAVGVLLLLGLAGSGM